MRRRLAGAMLCALAGTPLSVGAQSSALPPGLPVVRIDGAAAAPAVSLPPAQRPSTGDGLPVTRLEERGGAVELDGQRTVSLTLSQPMPLQNLLRLLVRGTAFSVVAEESVAGTFSGELKELTMREALEAVLFPRALDYDVRGHLIRVFARRPETRIFTVDYLAVTRAWERRARASSAVPPQAAAADLTVSAGGDRFDELEKGIGTLLSGAGRVHVDRLAGVVQVTDFADRLDRIGVYVDTVRERASRQVRLDARMIEVTLADGAASLDWNAVAIKLGAPAASRRSSGLVAGDTGAIVKAIEDQGAVRTIAVQQLVAMNNEPALMRVGSQAVYFTAAGTGTGDGRVQGQGTAGSVAEAAMEGPMEGMTLTVTAQIAADGVVQLSVSPTLAERTGEARPRRGDAVPVLSIAEADTIVRLQEGSTAVVSGFLRERDRTRQGRGVTGFFGAQKREVARTELVLLLTPTVVGPGVSGLPR